MQDTVADFAAVVVDRQGIVHNQCAVLVAGHFGNFPLFHFKGDDGTIWGQTGLEKRQVAYENMLSDGRRTLASVPAINRWLARAQAAYKPFLTAYNLPFDTDKTARTGIDLEQFRDGSFCLWRAAVGTICNTKAYKAFVLENHLFNNRTDLGNMSFSTNAENVASFLSGTVSKEPHTALEDIMDFELPILQRVLKIRRWQDKMISYNWRNHQIKDHFKPR